MQLKKFLYGEEMQIFQDLTDFVDGTFYSKVFTEWVQAERKYRTPLRNTEKNKTYPSNKHFFFVMPQLTYPGFHFESETEVDTLMDVQRYNMLLIPSSRFILCSY